MQNTRKKVPALLARRQSVNPEPSGSAPMATAFIRFQSLVGDRATSSEEGRGGGGAERSRIRGKIPVLLRFLFFASFLFQPAPVTFNIIHRPSFFFLCGFASLESYPFNRKAFGERKT